MHDQKSNKITLYHSSPIRCVPPERELPSTRRFSPAAICPLTASGPHYRAFPCFRLPCSPERCLSHGLWPPPPGIHFVRYVHHCHGFTFFDNVLRLFKTAVSRQFRHEFQHRIHVFNLLCKRLVIAVSPDSGYNPEVEDGRLFICQPGEIFIFPIFCVAPPGNR